MARAKDERGGRRLGGQTCVISEGEQAAIEALAQFKAPAGVGALAWQLKPAGPEADRVVVGHDARIAATQERGQIAGRRPPGRGRLGRGPRKARGEVGEELGEERVGTVQGVDASQTQLGDEAILQGLPEAFDAALGLRGASGDEPDAELAQDSPEVGGILGAAEFFLEGPVRVVAHEDIEPIAVEREGQAVARAELFEQGDIAVQILGGAQVEGQAGARGVVDGAVQGEPGPPSRSQGKGLASSCTRAPRWASGVRRVRTWRPRRRRLAGSPKARRRRRTELRLRGTPSTSRSFSVAWQSFRPAYGVCSSAAARA